MNDADIMTAQLERAGNRAAELKRKGLCVHGWRQNQSDGLIKCLDCGKIATDEELEDDRAELL